jgi:hypothetical protein
MPYRELLAVDDARGHLLHDLRVRPGALKEPTVAVDDLLGVAVQAEFAKENF